VRALDHPAWRAATSAERHSARTELTPRQTFERGLDLFCRGVLTEAGRREIEAPDA